MPARVVILVALVVAAAVAGAGRLDIAGSSSEMQATDTVVRVVDGDTVVLRAAGKSRLIGVDTPEVFGRPECFGAEASRFAKTTLRPGMAVNVQRDAQPRDRYGRSLIYLTLADGRSFNELLVKQGFALPMTIAPNVRHAARFRELAGRARSDGAGLWSPATCDGRVDGRSHGDREVGYAP
jgi:micrococcal nuclease